MKRILMLLSLGLFVGGCGADGGPAEPGDVPEFSDWWKGSLSGDRVLILASEGDGGTITGSGSVGDYGVWAIHGSHTHPNLTFAASSVDAALGAWTFSGAFTNDDTVEGSIAGDDFGGALVLTRDSTRNDR